MGAQQLTLIVHEGDPYELEWHEPDTGRLHNVVIRPGAIDILPPDRPFYQRWSSRPRILLVTFEPALVAEVGQAFGGKTAAEINLIIGGRDSEIEALGNRLKRELIDGDPNGAVVAEAFAKALLVHIFRVYQRLPGHASVVRGGLDPQKLADVLDYIDDNLTEKITLGGLAAVAGLSPHHFSEAFKTMTGMPPIRFVIRRRVEKAVHYLATTDRTISDIAHDLGFPSHGHLSTYFKRDLGTAPSRFRSEWRRKGGPEPHDPLRTRVAD